MLRKQKLNLKFLDKKVDTLYQIATALGNTFVVNAFFKGPGHIFKTKRIVHQTTEGKELLQLYNDSTSKKAVYRPFQMMNDREVILFLETAGEVEIQVINLKSKHISRSFLDKKIFEQKLNKQIYWTLDAVFLFPQTQLVSIVVKDYDNSYTGVSYFKYSQLQEGKAKCVKQYTFQGQNVEAQKVNNCSKMAVWKLGGFTLTFLTIINQNEELTTISNLIISWFDSKQDKKVNNSKQYSLMRLTECRTDLYFHTIFQMSYETGYNVRKYGFLDTSKQATVSKKVLISTDGITSGQVCFQPLKDTIFFYGPFNKAFHRTTSPTYLFDFQQQTMVAADHQQAGVKCLQDIFFFPNWDKNTIARAQLKSRGIDEIEIIVTTFFPLKDFIMHMLLHLNEDFDDDLLQDAISMLCET